MSWQSCSLRVVGLNAKANGLAMFEWCKVSQVTAGPTISAISEEILNEKVSATDEISPNQDVGM